MTHMVSRPQATPPSTLPERGYATINPSTGEHVRDFPFLESDQVDAVVEAFLTCAAGQ